MSRLAPKPCQGSGAQIEIPNKVLDVLAPPHGTSIYGKGPTTVSRRPLASVSTFTTFRLTTPWVAQAPRPASDVASTAIMLWRTGDTNYAHLAYRKYVVIESPIRSGYYDDL